MPYIKSNEGTVYLVGEGQKVTRDVLEAEVNQAKEQLERLEAELKNFDEACVTAEVPAQPESIPEDVQAVVPEPAQEQAPVADDTALVVGAVESPATPTPEPTPNIVIQ